MTDRQLLELAAKAAGTPLEYFGGVHFFGNQAGWNPLTDDGDESRLESLLEMHVSWMPALHKVSVGTAEIYAEESYGSDRQEARRLAGVRAAAEIGKGMK